MRAREKVRNTTHRKVPGSVDDEGRREALRVEVLEDVDESKSDGEGRLVGIGVTIVVDNESDSTDAFLSLHGLHSALQHVHQEFNRAVCVGIGLILSRSADIAQDEKMLRASNEGSAAPLIANTLQKLRFLRPSSPLYGCFFSNVELFLGPRKGMPPRKQEQKKSELQVWPESPDAFSETQGRGVGEVERKKRQHF